LRSYGPPSIDWIDEINREGGEIVIHGARYPDRLEKVVAR
jgi:hypothetical protein